MGGAPAPRPPAPLPAKRPSLHSIAVICVFDAHPCVCVSSQPDSLLTQFGRLNESIIKRYVKQVVDALAFLHGNGIVHGNVSIDHLLVTSTESTLGCIKLAGFLSAWRIRRDSNRIFACVVGWGRLRAAGTPPPHPPMPALWPACAARCAYPTASRV
jgi:serine/threonine protein kinase